VLKLFHYELEIVPKPPVALAVAGFDDCGERKGIVHISESCGGTVPKAG